MKKTLFMILITCATALGFPHPPDKGSDIPLNIENNTDQMMGCIGDCAACHTLTPIEAQSILGQKFDIKKVLSIAIKNGYFEVKYETSKGKKEKINLFFSKDKACREIILLNE